MIETRKITGLPTKADAEDCIDIWNLTPGAIQGSESITREGGTWTASMDFDVGGAVRAMGLGPASPASSPRSSKPARTKTTTRVSTSKKTSKKTRGPGAGRRK